MNDGSHLRADELNFGIRSILRDTDFRLDPGPVLERSALEVRHDWGSTGHDDEKVSWEDDASDAAPADLLGDGDRRGSSHSAPALRSPPSTASGDWNAQRGSEASSWHQRRVASYRYRSV
jgi:hypothetical protein